MLIEKMIISMVDFLIDKFSALDFVNESFASFEELFLMVWDYVANLISFAFYFLPIPYIMPLFSLVFGIVMIRIIVALLKLLIDIVPVW